MRKHTDQNFHMVVETQAIYERITRPYIESIPAEKIEWVYNILEQYVALFVVSLIFIASYTLKALLY